MVKVDVKKLKQQIFEDVKRSIFFIFVFKIRIFLKFRPLENSKLKGE
jgi:hypothetical protein